MAPIQKYISGSKIGELTILSRNKIHFECLCSCGKICTRTVSFLCKKKDHVVHSCGCKNLVGKKYGGYSVLEILLKVKYGAKKRHLEFDNSITPQYLFNLYDRQKGICAVSGLEISLPKKQKDSYTASLDRINSRLGYLKKNIQWVHKDINIMKWDHNQDKFIELCKTITDFQRNKNHGP